MSWLRGGLALLGGLAVGALFGDACVLSSGDCACREPRPLVRGTFRVTEAESSSVQAPEIAPLRTATLTIAEGGVVIDYSRGGAPLRTTYTVANKYEIPQ